MREWIAKIEEAGQLRRITAEVDWDLELAAIARRVATQEGPVLLFENMKDYHNTICRKLFIGGLGTVQGDDFVSDRMSMWIMGIAICGIMQVLRTLAFGTTVLEVF